MQHEMRYPHHLHNHRGRLIEAGYSLRPMIMYHSQLVKTSRVRLKEWDYFFIGNKDYGLSLTLADNRYMGVSGIQFFDFNQQKKEDFTTFFMFPRGRLGMPHQSFDGHVSFQNKTTKVDFDYEFNHVRIQAYGLNQNHVNIQVDITLEKSYEDMMAIVIPFKKPKQFYYNQKFNHLKAKGYFMIDDKRYDVSDLYGVLDWGRGVWPYDNTWYWSSASGTLSNGKIFGLNLGYGFGDTSQATENMIYYGGKGYKMDDITFDIPEDYISTWQIHDTKKNIQLTFEPIYDHQTKINYVILGQDAHQVFGVFKGFVVINDEKIQVDNIFGFAEKVRNRW
ncbi:MAG TPA: DUF2804 domain-containing protein [Acholeplasmataceae bacterium]|nr:DUF2804 domain-containing protein [Acholeplasmataceae bacterium]HRX44586.1 DUF2804 domain-containing protein [Acholeplasmataceae bacterium]